MRLLNSFQKWANHHARGFAFYVEFTGNWVKLWRSDGESWSCMTTTEVIRVCREHNYARFLKEQEDVT